MRVVYGLDNIDADLRGGVLSIGNFDGVHLGHQRILRHGAELAREVSGPLIVMTFDPHPLSIILPDRVPPPLTPINEKLAQLSEAGADVVVVVHADHDFLSLSADAFVEQVILGRCRALGVVEGPSFTYGRNRGGDVGTLRAAGARSGFEVRIVEPLEVEIALGDRKVISSSLIRGAIAVGDVELAARALGRPYALIGPVVRGRERGRRLGFPTANVATGGQLLPVDGVYAGAVTVVKEQYPAAISIGRAPTFEEGERLVEAYLLDFDRPLYDATIRVEVEVRLRPQQKFVSVDELVAQMKKDIAAVRERHQSARRRAPA